MNGWAFVTKHGLMLAYVAKHPKSTAREIASAIHVTERTVHKCIADLEAEGYIERRRVGRNNMYRVNRNLMLRHDTTQYVQVGDLLKVLGSRR